jgi:4-aminobutyrate aminotransferase/(S)-3-amino-2-methylpropionate transaminase
VIGKAEVMDRMRPGMLGTTFGGNPVSIAAALATLDVVEEEGLLERATVIGERLGDVLRGLQGEFEQIGDVRGVGAMIGVEFVTGADRTPNPAAVEAVVAHARDHGLLLLPTGTYGNVIRLLPPLNLSDAELDEGAETLEAAIRHALAPMTAVA